MRCEQYSTAVSQLHFDHFRIISHMIVLIPLGNECSLFHQGESFVLITLNHGMELSEGYLEKALDPSFVDVRTE